MSRILSDFAKKKTDILVGTQLVAKGLDFDNVGVAGIIAADVTLNLPDFRATERTFQLITQAAGRAGRGEKQGLVVVQTYEPDNYTFRFAKDNDYEAFFEEEIKLRRFMQYPPFGDIIEVNFTATHRQEAISAAIRCEAYMKNAIGKEDEANVLSHKADAMFGGKDSFREYIVIKCPKSGGNERNLYMFYLESFQKKLTEENSKVNVTVDVNPYNIF